MLPAPARFVLSASLAFAPLIRAFAPIPGAIAARSIPHHLHPIRLSSSPNDDELSITSGAIASLLGGDYAGHSAQFSSSDGKLIPVPEHLVPESLIEWGQIPSCLEVLSSEDVAIATTGDEIGLQLERGIVSVLPEVGCGVDNLDTMRTAEILQLSTVSESTASAGDVGIGPGQFYAFAEDEDVAIEDGECRRVLAWQTEMAPLREAPRIKLETVFALPSEMGPSIDDDEAEASFERRIRVSFEALPLEKKIPSPISIVLERRIEHIGSDAQWGVGGGLDGRTVSKLIGKDSVNKPFADREPLVVGSDEDGDDSGGGEVTLSLPGNIVLRCDTLTDGRWFIDLISVSTAVNEESEGKMMISGTTTVRWILNSDESLSSAVNCYFQ
jgi:hypothetical protein